MNIEVDKIVTQFMHKCKKDGGFMYNNNGGWMMHECQSEGEWSCNRINAWIDKL